MELLRELLAENETGSKKKGKNKKDKTADKYFTYVAGNMLFRNVCSGKLAGDKK